MTMNRTVAATIAWGVFLVIIAPCLLGASWYAALMQPEYGTRPATPLAFIGWGALLLGAALLAGGLFARWTAVAEPAAEPALDGTEVGG